MSPFKSGRCGIPSRLTFGKRSRASINRTSHHPRKRGGKIHTILIHTSPPSSRTPLLGGYSSFVLVHPQPTRQSTTPHWSRVLHHNGGPNQYKSCVLVFFGFGELVCEIVECESVGEERSSCAPQCSNLKGFAGTRNPTNTSPQEVVLPLYLFIPSLQGNPPHHTGVGYYTTSVARTSINSCVPCSSGSAR